MPKFLDPIPVGAQIVDTVGRITIFYRLRWEQLRASFQLVPTRAAQAFVGQNAALATTALYLTLTPGLYRVTTYARKTTADGVSSSLTLTLGWTENAVPLTLTLAAMAADSTTVVQAVSTPLLVDANVNITLAAAYASNTPNAMIWEVSTTVEQMA